jgi:hypothetical protein
VLLVGAGLLIRTSVAIYGVTPGFSTKNILTMSMSLAGKKYETSTAIDRLVRDGVERIQAIPGVELASATCCLPLGNSIMACYCELWEGRWRRAHFMAEVDGSPSRPRILRFQNSHGERPDIH